MSTIFLDQQRYQDKLQNTVLTGN